MASPISPGVFLQDHRCPPEWQGKGAVLFIGPFQQGPVGVPVSVRTAHQAEQVFGRGDGIYLTATSLRQFFDQGGRTAMVLRVPVGAAYPQLQSDLQIVPAEEVTHGLLGSEFDPGPDPICPDMPGWNAALGAAMVDVTEGEGRSLLQEIAPGRLEMIVAPVLSQLPPAQARAAYRKLHQICVEKDLFLLLDPPASPEADPGAWFEGFGLGRSEHAIAFDSQVASIAAPQSAIPPSGAIAGVLDRVAGQKGIWAAASGKRACLENMKLAAQYPRNSGVSARLNVLTEIEGGVALPAEGVFSRAGTDAPRLRVLRILRKTRLTLRRELDRLLLETQAQSRRSEARLIAEALMVQLWNDGALRGNSAAQAFRVVTIDPKDETERFELCVGLALQSPGKFFWVSVDAS